MSAAVLVIEDDSAQRAMLDTLVSRLGCQVVSAADGRHGLAAAHEHDPALILLDMILPDIDGLEVLRRLRRDPLTARTPILVVTAVDDNHRVVEALEAGADDYVPKPFEAAVLQARMKVLLRTARLQRDLARQAERSAAASAVAQAAAEAGDVRMLCAAVADSLGLPGRDLEVALWRVDGDHLSGPYGRATRRAEEPLGLDVIAGAGLSKVCCGEVPWQHATPDQLGPLATGCTSAEAVALPLRHGGTTVALAVIVAAGLRDADLRRLSDRCPAAAAALSAALDRLAREASDARYRSLLEQAGDGVAVLDAAGYTCREINQALASWLSATPLAFAGRPFAVLFAEESRPRLGEALSAAAAGRRLTIGDLWLRGQGQRGVPVELTLRRVTHGTGAEILTVVRDLRHREAAERYEQTASDLGSLSRVVRALNHEINNPLTCIIGLTQLLQMRLEQMPEHLSQLEKILNSAEQITELSNQLREAAIDLGGEQTLSDIERTIDRLADSAAG
ncbi:MAG: response regulator [Armatimonadetes bacterium]|nr:response regulator [Armatimonadota bacterium]